jgi:hypothetical protein
MSGLSDEEKQKQLPTAKDRIKNNLYKEYDFKVPKAARTSKDTIKQRNSLIDAIR